MSANIIKAIGVIIFAYLVGSLNFAVIFSKIFTGRDVRKEGSGNAGTTNMLRSVGKLPAALTFVFDALKGFVACFAGKTVFTHILENGGNAEIFVPIYGAYLCCVAVMLGHIYPVFFGFKGGKAVACSVGTFAVCCPIAIILGLVGFAVCLAVSKIVSLSSLVATVIVVGVATIYCFVSPAVDYNVIPAVILILMAGFIVFIKHKDNIVRLANGTEKKISAKKENK